MKNLNYLTKLFLLGSALLFCGVVISQNTISGVVTDESGEALIGANVVVEGTTDGSITDFDGSFSVTTSASFPFNLIVSFTGFNTETFSVTSASSDIRVALTEGVLIGEDVVISASRKREKVQEAPASITILTARKLEASPQIDATRNLVNVPGVTVQQQSAARINIEMRGAAGIFGTSAFPILDYRSLVGPGIGTFQSDVAGISTIDLQRIEIVRGPGSALYGPGVTSGVIHFISKNPIDFPGTTVELFGGELSTFGASIRHAGRNANKTFGYKFNAHYKRGNEFTLDPIEDAAQIAKFKTQVIQPGVSGGVVDVTQPSEVLMTTADLDPDGDGNMMRDNWWNTAINGSLEFRPQDDLNLTVSAGYNRGAAVFYNSQGEGLFQGSEYWGQARVQKGGLFAQIFYVDNNGGTKENPTFLYQTGNRTPVARKQLETQIQYNFGTPGFLDGDWTAGFDYRLAKADTEHLVYGRNEDDDDFSIVGGYIQGKLKLDPKLDLILAGRYDQFNFIDDGTFSPRAGLVFKPSPKHSFRATYNRSSSSVSNLQLNIDFPVATPVPGLFDIWLYGNKTEQTFDANPMIDVTIPGVPDLPFGTPGFPLAIAYGAVTPTLLANFAALVGQEVLPGVIFTAQQFALLQALLGNPANAPSGFSGNLVPYNIFTRQPLTPIDAPISKLSITDTYEFGYKGLIADKLGVSIDLYNNRSKDFTLFTAISPTIGLFNENIAADLGAAVQNTLQPQIEGALLAAGLDPVSAATQAAIFGALLGGAYTQAGAAFVGQVGALFPIFGAVETNQVPQDGLVHSAAGYRTFGELSYWGADIGLEYFVSDEFSFFGNYSWLEQTEFSGADLGEPDDSPLSFSLGIPKNKFRFGFNYAAIEGWRASLSFQHDDSFNADFGQFSGQNDEKNLVDASIGYKLSNGVAIDLSATNLFDSEYRAFNNFPKIGRRLLAKMTYNFGGE